VAAARAGLAPETRLLPEPSDPLLLATVSLATPAGTAGGDDDLARLHPAIRQRHTSRHPFAEKDLPEEVQAALQQAAAQEGATLLFPGPWHSDTVLELVHDAENRDDLDPAARGDLVRWTRLGPDAATA